MAGTRRINYSALRGKCSRDRQRCYSGRNFLTLQLLRRKTGPNDSSIHDRSFGVSEPAVDCVHKGKPRSNCFGLAS